MNLNRIAEIISLALHPFIMVVVITIITAAGSGGLIYSVGSAMLIILLVLLPLTLFIRHKVKSRKWENIDASNKGERPSFYITTIILLTAVVIILTLFSVFVFLIKGMLSVIILLAFHFLLNNYIKASLHTAFIVFTAVVAHSIFPIAGYCIAALIPVLIWSRLQLKRHTILEIAAGILTGGLAGVVVRLL